MTKLEWCKEHAPSSLIGASEIEILAAMSPFYDDYLSYTKQESSTEKEEEVILSR